MLTAKVTSKGQITIPKNIRDNLGLYMKLPHKVCPCCGLIKLSRQIQQLTKRFLYS